MLHAWYNTPLKSTIFIFENSPLHSEFLYDICHIVSSVLNLGHTKVKKFNIVVDIICEDKLYCPYTLQTYHNLSSQKQCMYNHDYNWHVTIIKNMRSVWNEMCLKFCQN